MNQASSNSTVKTNHIFINTFIVFCLCFMSMGCGSHITPNNSPGKSEPALGNISSDIYQVINNCSSLTKPENILHDDIQIPQSQGLYIEDCNNNPNYNACIYHHDPFTQDNRLITEFRNIFNERLSLVQTINFSIGDMNWINNERNNKARFSEAMRLYQTYAVNITGTIDGFLRNEHYNIKNSIRFQQQPNGKWTMPYMGPDEIPSDHPQYRSVEQVMAYYYLMYQKEWMELNVGKWYASGQNISINFASHNYWNSEENEIRLKSSENLFERSVQIPSAMNASLIAHEAGHANFYYSNLSREGSKENAYRRCKFDPNAPHIDKCCPSADGCFKAISEGQSDFHALMISPNLPLELSFEKYIRTLMEGVETNSPTLYESGYCEIPGDPRANKELKAEEAFNCSGAYTKEEDKKGEIHDMGKLYASIWWEIYNHPEVSKRDIATLFSAHLSTVSYDDTFKTVAVKIIDKARDLFDKTKEDHYTCIIFQEFAKRDLTPAI